MGLENVQKRGSQFSALACQYLYNSSDLFLKALDKYNSASYGEVSYALSDFHKAWDALWQADSIVKNNGYMTGWEARESLYFLQIEKICKAHGITLPNTRNLQSYTKAINSKKIDSKIKNIFKNLKDPHKVPKESFLYSLTDVLNKLQSKYASHPLNPNEKPCESCRGYCSSSVEAGLSLSKNPYITKTWYKSSNYGPGYSLDGQQIKHYKYDQNGNQTFVFPTSLQVVVPGWNSELASRCFQEICNPTSPVFYNLYLFKLFRNAAQHDYIELAQGSYEAVTEIMNPYVAALLLNFIQAYTEVYEQVVEQCHQEHRRNSSCARKHLQDVFYLRSRIRLPYTFGYINSKHVFLVPFNKNNRGSTELKTVRKLIIEKLNETFQQMKLNRSLTEEDIERLKQNPKFCLIPNKKTNINHEDYPYSSLQKVADAITASGIFVTRHQVQTALDKLTELDLDRREEWVYEFFGKKRYSRAFEVNVRNFYSTF